MNIKEFFNSFASEYTAAIKRDSPRYSDMIHSLVESLPKSFVASNILELGCGTGNLTLALQHTYPQANITATDSSDELLAICRHRLPKHVKVKQMDMRDFTQPNEPYDLICSSLAIHHLSSDEKSELFNQIFHAIQDGGFFIFCDLFRSEAKYLDEINQSIWHSDAFEAGTSEEEWNKWQYHVKMHDKPDSLANQMTWLKESGFSVVECVWRYASWGGIHCRK